MWINCRAVVCCRVLYDIIHRLWMQLVHINSSIMRSLAVTRSAVAVMLIMLQEAQAIRGWGGELGMVTARSALAAYAL